MNNSLILYFDNLVIVEFFAFVAFLISFVWTFINVLINLAI